MTLKATRPFQPGGSAADRRGESQTLQAVADSGAAAWPLPDPRTILNSIGEVIYDWNLMSDLIVWGPNAGEVLGLADLEPLSSGRAYGEYLAPQSPASRFETVMASTQRDTGSGVAYKVTYGLVIAPDAQKVIWVEDTGRWYAGTNGHPVRAHGIIRLVTEQYEAERQSARRSQLDKLTGAFNRSHFVEQASHLLGSGAQTSSPVAILIATIENLPFFNQTYGYAIGDELIVAAASKIRESMRSNDIFARYGGNKFAMLLESCDAERMAVAAERFLAAVEVEPLPTSAGGHAISMRIGGISASTYGRNPQILLHHAEEALDCAQQSSTSHYAAYEPNRIGRNAKVHTRQVSMEIVSALDERRLVLAAQPIVHAATGQLAFYEGLMRINRPDGHVTGPIAVLPVAEQTGLVRLIDQRMLELAAAHLSQEPALRFAINASGATIHAPRWPDSLHAICQTYPNIAARLTIEITETCAMLDMPATCRAIAAMKACGVKVAMDDFGAGNTSFRSLRGLDIDLLKIDGAFVQNLARSPDDRFFVRTLLDLARHLEIPTVAEWVEDEETARILADWGVDYLQGFYFGEARILGQDDEEDSAAVA